MDKIPNNRRDKVIKVLSTDSFATCISIAITIGIGLLIGLIILLVSYPGQGWNAFVTLISGGFNMNGVMGGIGSTIYYSIPLILIGLAFGVAYRAGVFNIGTPGQYTFGAVGAISIAVLLEPTLGDYTWILAIVIAAVLGMLWSLISGILRQAFNVNIIISGIMLNYIAIYLLNWFIKSVPALYDKPRSWTTEIPANTVIPRLGLDTVFDGKPVNIGIIIAIIIAVILWYIIKNTTIGFEIRATGLNPEAARYAGISITKSSLIAIAISGALAGLGGGLYFLSAQGTHHFIHDTIATEGFMGIAVALLGMLNPIGTVFAGLFISYLKVGGQSMQVFGVQSEIATVISAIIIFMCAISFKFKSLWLKFINKIGGGQS